MACLDASGRWATLLSECWLATLDKLNWYLDNKEREPSPKSSNGMEKHLALWMADQTQKYAQNVDGAGVCPTER
eukprot:490877-Pleurochrysis_carterae.AAC.1